MHTHLCTRPVRNLSRRMVVAWHLAFVLFFAGVLVTSPAIAQQRNPLQTIGTTVADHPSAHYQFQRFTVASADQMRIWRVHLAIPHTETPDQGFPSFWMLDGNAALMEFDQPLLAELASQSVPHVLIFIGSNNDLRIDSQARTRDYTPLHIPPIPSSTLEQGPTGGADAFLEIIERNIRSEVLRRVKLNLERQAIWGHSLGGLFVLHACFTRTGAFQTYLSGSPSMWWGNAHAAKAAERFIAHHAGHPATLVIHLGGAERRGDLGNRDLTNPRVVEHLERIKAAPPDAAWRLSERLKDLAGLKVSYREFPELGHGPMFRASLLAGLHAVTGIADRSLLPPPAASASDSPQPASDVR